MKPGQKPTINPELAALAHIRKLASRGWSSATPGDHELYGDILTVIEHIGQPDLWPGILADDPDFEATSKAATQVAGESRTSEAFGEGNDPRAGSSA